MLKRLTLQTTYKYLSVIGSSLLVRGGGRVAALKAVWLLVRWLGVIVSREGSLCFKHNYYCMTQSHQAEIIVLVLGQTFRGQPRSHSVLMPHILSKKTTRS